MYHARHFIYDGVSSEELGLSISYIGKPRSNDASLGADLDVDEEFIPRRIRSLFYGVSETKPLEFDLSMAAEEPMDRYQLEEIASNLAGKQKYAWFEFDQADMRDYRFRCILNEFKIQDVAGKPIGLICTVHCDSPYAWEYPKKYEAVVGEEGTTTLTIYNTSSTSRHIKPKMEINLPTGAQSFEVKNIEDSGRIFKLSSSEAFTAPASFSIDNDRQIINSGDAHVTQNCYTYLKDNGYKFFRLVKGKNTLQITAPAGTKVTITCEFPKRVGG